MKIIIVGGGIGGVSVFLALKKHLADASPPAEILLFEAHDSLSATTSIVGGALGLAPNGLRAISQISVDAAEYIQERGFPGEVMTFRNSQGTLLGRFRAGRKARYGFGELMLPRATVHDALVRELRPGDMLVGKGVQSVKELDDNELVEVKFEDGTTERADLVIGADGVRSVVREAIYGDKYGAVYEGLTGVGGFIALSALSEPLRASLREDPVTMTFGARGFFGYCPNTPNLDDLDNGLLGWWSTYETNEPPPRDTPPETILSQLLERHAAWKSPADSSAHPIFRELVTLGCTSSVGPLLILPGYVTPRLPHWTSLSGSGRILLLGDAAHAMPPHAGQGVACAAEDAVAIAILLKHYRVSHRFEIEEALRRTGEAYEAVRMKRLAKILDAAKYGSASKKTQSWFQEKVRDWFMWLLCKLPESWNDGQFSYDVEAEIARYIPSSGCEAKIG
ncbi:FAD-binding protein [Mycena kentingensis (nom. inval.)]|nr:FAD-binding protein [Mycena kentingensis (nom. inval.)]